MLRRADDRDSLREWQEFPGIGASAGHAPPRRGTPHDCSRAPHPDWLTAKVVSAHRDRKAPAAPVREWERCEGYETKGRSAQHLERFLECAACYGRLQLPQDGCEALPGR